MNAGLMSPPADLPADATKFTDEQGRVFIKVPRPKLTAAELEEAQHTADDAALDGLIRWAELNRNRAVCPEAFVQKFEPLLDALDQLAAEREVVEAFVSEALQEG